MNELEKWSTLEEKVWHQKSRVTWIQLGESNTRFFHAHVKQRRSQNSIKLLFQHYGTKLKLQDQIKKEIIMFYQPLMGSDADSLPMVDRDIIHRGPVLGHDVQTQLCNSISAEEVKGALFSMDSLKAPGIDGYNVHFFKKTWSILGNDIFDVVCDFFSTAMLPKQINFTNVTLLPKVNNASSVKDFRLLLVVRSFIRSYQRF